MDETIGAEVTPSANSDVSLLEAKRSSINNTIATGSVFLAMCIGFGSLGYMGYHTDRMQKDAAILSGEFSSAYHTVTDTFGPNVSKLPPLLRLAEENFPHNSWLSFIRGAGYINDGMNISAVSHRNPILMVGVDLLVDSLSNEKTYTAHLQLGKALARLERFNEAAIHLEAAYGRVKVAETSALDTEIHTAANWLEYVSFCQRDGIALEEYAGEAQRRKELPNEHTYLGVALMWRGDTERAREEFYQSLAGFEEQNPKNYHERWVKARHLLMANQGLVLLGEQDHSGDVDDLVGFYGDTSGGDKQAHLSPTDLERILQMPARL
ncbi:hypothetical protein J4444_02880 [Candidatus Woesearchaeota archaeon]|nr:hypothetical protein [Candidatus Woesearchaeota archaeon]